MPVEGEYDARMDCEGVGGTVKAAETDRSGGESSTRGNGEGLERRRRKR